MCLGLFGKLDQDLWTAKLHSDRQWTPLCKSFVTLCTTMGLDHLNSTAYHLGKTKNRTLQSHTVIAPASLCLRAPDQLGHAGSDLHIKYATPSVNQHRAIQSFAVGIDTVSISSPCHSPRTEHPQLETRMDKARQDMVPGMAEEAHKHYGRKVEDRTGPLQALPRPKDKGGTHIYDRTKGIDRQVTLRRWPRPTEPTTSYYLNQSVPTV